MRYVDHVLQPGETVQAMSRLHWVVYLPGAILFFLGLAGLSSVSAWNDPDVTPELHQIFRLAGGFLALIGLWRLARAFIRRFATEIAVTDRRIIFKNGLIRRRTIEMNLDKVESIDVDQSVAGRIFDYGTILVRGTGASLEPLRLITRPIEFRNKITAR